MRYHKRKEQPFDYYSLNSMEQRLELAFTHTVNRGGYNDDYVRALTETIGALKNLKRFQ